MIIFGELPDPTRALLATLRQEAAALPVGRRDPGRSDTPFPTSGDLEREFVPIFTRHGFAHHVDLRHPRTGERFEYDFFRADFGIAVEIMGYRADDEVYRTSSSSTSMAPRGSASSGCPAGIGSPVVETLVAFVYDWRAGAGGRWMLQHIEVPDTGGHKAISSAGSTALSPERNHNE